MPWKQAMQRVLSRGARRVYRAAPIFGRLRGAVAVLGDGPEYTVIERSDGLGLSFPGGMLWPWEAPEQGVRREVREETGLALRHPQRLFVYDDDAIIPARTFVFRAQADGEPRGSWEGRVLRVSLEELRRRIVASERPIVSYLLKRPLRD